jgi:hypothetical protein
MPDMPHMQGLSGYGRTEFWVRRRLLVCVQGGFVAFDPGFELGELAVG